MTRPLSINKKLMAYFKDYVRKVLAVQKVTVLDECDMVYCLEMAIDKANLDFKESTMVQLIKSKNDISRNTATVTDEAHKTLSGYDKMVQALNIIAQWNDEDVTDADEPWAARNARAVLDEIGEVKINSNTIK